jgi:hypothetical protein
MPLEALVPESVVPFQLIEQLPFDFITPEQIVLTSAPVLL